MSVAIVNLQARWANL